jgi:AraC family transcriptional regulator of adaptative response / DNA-3-methyladenine glycosylase II
MHARHVKPDLSPSAAKYAAFQAKDARFDGHFFVGVTSTGIYCRPICRAKLPVFQRCRFYASAAAAEQAGFRPCLLCRPELAPGLAPVDAAASLAERAARLMRDECSSAQGLPDLARRLGCTDRHLRRVFHAAYQVTPIQYLQTCRLLLAKRLLSETRWSVLDVAMAAGFSSLRRFNSVFRQRYRMAPTALRRQAPAARPEADAIALTLAYRPPYAWDQMLTFLAARAVPGVECVVGGAYRRTVRLQTPSGAVLTGWFEVTHTPQAVGLCARMSASLWPVLGTVLSRIRGLFDLDADPVRIHADLASMASLRADWPVLGLRLPGCFDPFEMAVRAVLGQQISVKAARTLAQRMVLAFGEAVSDGPEGLSHCFPSAQALLALPGDLADHLGPLGITRTRARSIRALAQDVVDGQGWSDGSAEPAAACAALMRLPGIGAWTAHYLLMRVMGWPDAFLLGDVGVRKALSPRAPRGIAALAEGWRPWRSYAMINLWQAPPGDATP